MDYETAIFIWNKYPMYTLRVLCEIITLYGIIYCINTCMFHVNVHDKTFVTRLRIGERGIMASARMLDATDSLITR